MEISGHAAVVTGGASGLGAATATELARAGAKVACLDVDLKGARDVAARIGGHAIACDVTNAEQAAAALAEAHGRHGAARIIINCAGVGPAKRIVGREGPMPLAEFERALELDPRESSIPTEIGNSYLDLRRWSDAEQALSRALALDPHNINASYHLGVTYINGSGDIERARRRWKEGPEDPKGQVSQYGVLISQMIREDVYLDVLERHFADALKASDVARTDTADGRLRKLKARIGIQVLAGQNAAARPQCEQARVLLESQRAERPEDRTSVTELAWVYVCLGRYADALRVAREAAEALPMEKDAIVGANFLLGLAQIEAHTGQSEEAIKILGQLLKVPAGEYVSVTRLKIDPVWDPIRNDAGFQKLLSEPEPETVYK